MPTDPHPVVIVGAGISGLLIAARLQRAGLPVTVLEAASDLGGQIRTVQFAGHAVDIGAEAVFVNSPAIRTLLDDVGLLDSAVPAARGRSWIATDRGLRRLPAGVGPGGPTRLVPVLRSGMLPPTAMARAALEPVVTRLSPALPGDTDVSVGDFVSRRFGRAVTSAFVDPLLGGIQAGDVGRLSLRACTPTLVPAAENRRPLTRWRRPTPTGPRGAADMTFLSFPDGLSTLIRTLAAGLDDVRTNARVTALQANADGVVVTTQDDTGPQELTARAVVLATPAPVMVELLEPLTPAARSLAHAEAASVANLLVAYPLAQVRDNPALDGTGILVPSASGRLLKAATFLSRKWSQLSDEETFLVRLSAGRAGTDVADRLTDAELTDGMLADFTELTGVTAAPTATRLIRWSRTMPQQTVGHRERVVAARTALRERTDRVWLAGSAVDGVGLSGCLTQAERTAEELIRAFGR